MQIGNIMGITFPLKLITLSIDLGIGSDECDIKSKESIAEFLNKKLYEDPEFFGDFGPENILDIKDID
jgi:hypothetical protein